MRGLVARSDTELLQVAALELSWRIVDSAAAAYSRFNEPRIRGRERHMQAAHGIHAAGTRERRREVFQHVRQTELLQVSDARAQLGSSFQPPGTQSCVRGQATTWKTIQTILLPR